MRRAARRPASWWSPPTDRRSWRCRTAGWRRGGRSPAPRGRARPSSLQRAEPVDAGNVDGDDQIGVAAHALRAYQQMATRQRLQRLGQLGGRGETDLDGLAGVDRAPAPAPDPRRWCRRRDRRGRPRRRWWRRRSSSAARRASTRAPTMGRERQSSWVDRGHRCPQRQARYPAPRVDSSRPALTVRVGLARRAWHPAEPANIGICGACAGQQLLHVVQRYPAPCPGRTPAWV